MKLPQHAHNIRGHPCGHQLLALAICAVVVITIVVVTGSVDGVAGILLLLLALLGIGAVGLAGGDSSQRDDAAAVPPGAAPALDDTGDDA